MTSARLRAVGLLLLETAGLGLLLYDHIRGDQTLREAVGKVVAKARHL